MTFLAEALDHLRLINLQLENAHGTERRALEGARTELMKLISAARELTNNANCPSLGADP
jgi:hypothetical protein